MLFTGIVITAVIIAAFELGLRIFGHYPKGLFDGWIPDEYGGYPAYTRLYLPGPIPYTVEINSHGFRKTETEQEFSPDRLKIAAIGDSLTDGFFVDNPATYPYYLHTILKENGWDVEVFNTGYGSGSINKELTILQRRVLPLKPQIVILTFSTNDISDIQGLTREDLVRKKPDRKSKFLFVITKTAIGEWYYDIYLHWKSPAYLKAKELIKNPANRYQINGGDHFRENARMFQHHFKLTDGLVLHEPFSRETINLVENYCFVLERFQAICREQKITLLFVYSPAYPQIYDPTSSMRIREILSERCRQLSIPFLDLTQTFKDQGNRVLHLTPIDYHLNPEGNRVMATAIAQYLMVHLLPGRKQKTG